MPKLTRKRQVMIPETVCSQLGLEPGDMVEIFARDGVAHLVRMNDKPLAGQFAELANSQDIPSTDDIRQALKSRAAQKFKEN